MQVKVALLQMICLARLYGKLKTKLPFVMRVVIKERRAISPREEFAELEPRQILIELRNVM